jgi:hypothetical protein
VCLEHQKRFNQSKNKGSTKNEANQFITPSNYQNFLLGKVNRNHKVSPSTTREFYTQEQQLNPYPTFKYPTLD